MKYLVVVCLLVLGLSSIVSAKSTLQAIEKYASTLKLPEVGIEMVVKYILRPFYGKDPADFGLQIEDLQGVENIASASNENIAEAIQKLMAEYADQQSHLEGRQLVNRRIKTLLLDPCAELEQRLGKLISSLDGSTREEYRWIAKRAICRRVTTQTQDIQLAVCQRVGC